jgi:hypothetical protein
MVSIIWSENMHEIVDQLCGCAKTSVLINLTFSYSFTVHFHKGKEVNQREDKCCYGASLLMSVSLHIRNRQYMELATTKLTPASSLP